ncbi:bifunctional 3'-5' exonuclease/DNA polymerase [Desertivibrio insolitus]|uniref:bifunctional 3'-5' exonuclease/DNA polymerase n=1 Tax=Herbiconiux sp. SYSU D00978 TaxID=2812562 RepID=UPI001A95DFCE|nr:bifunctional 3'-5' exonuclease/DNA polymerase [Herbiconiux sp. SYSU D00978]
MFAVLSRAGDPDAAALTVLDASGALVRSEEHPRRALPAVVTALEADRPRWVWDDTARWYPPLLAAGVRVERCVDLRLCHAILRNSVFTTESSLATAPRSTWDAPGVGAADPGALFDLGGGDAEPDRDEVLAEFAAQQAAVDGSPEPGRIALLLAAESVGALLAAEMTHAGLPWRADVHDRLLSDLLGPRPAPGLRPARLESTLDEVRRALDDDTVNPDSPAALLAALRRAGIEARSTRSWELERVEHPAIEPLLRYKKLARLLAANGWHWLDTWVSGGRFRPVFVPGGVVTGRWASNGGGALQLPQHVRGAVLADEGWTFVVADAAQLEPRVLAAMAGDTAMAKAGQGTDLYEGMVRSGAVERREQAKYGMLGAMYGGTSGESGRMLPRLARAYPRAIGLVEEAARAGERGERVSTRLGRSSPKPGSEWQRVQASAYGDEASELDERRARGDSRAWGRFTRNFVVQGTAAEWALCWLGSLRRRLWQLGAGQPGDGQLTDRPHLVFFLHDEVIVHTPEHLAAEVAQAVQAAADEAGRLLFGSFPIEFRLSVATVRSYADAKD